MREAVEGPPSPVDRRVQGRGLSFPLLLIILFLLFAFGCSRPGGGGQPRSGGAPSPAAGGGDGLVLSVEAVRVKKARLERRVAVGARVVPRAEHTVGARIPGRVAEVPVEEGERVGKGQLLARLEDAEIRIQLDLARLQADTAASVYGRMDRLYAEGGISHQQWEQARLQLAQARAALDNLREQLGYTRILSPVDGVLLERRVDPGEQVAPGAPLFTVADVSVLFAEGQVGEAEARFLRPGLPARIWAGTSPQTGQVDSLSPAADPRTRSVTVKVRLPGGLSPPLGSYAQVEIPVASAEAPVIPLEALAERSGRRGVFVAEGGVARFREVVLGLDDGRRAEVLSGVREGEAVIVTGLHRLEDGSRVEATLRP